jgi:hypothetical protein
VWRRCADSAHLSHETLAVVVLVGSKGWLVGTGEVCRHWLLLRSRLRLGGIPLTGARGLRDLGIHDQGMTVVHGHRAPVAGQCWIGIGLAGQERVGIGCGAVGLVAELDAEDIT